MRIAAIGVILRRIPTKGWSAPLGPDVRVLTQLRHGRLQAFAAHRALEHPEWLALLLEHEITLRRQKRFEARARAARLCQSATIEEVDYRAARGLDRALFRKR
jgi:DNA replication protein DnaC